MGRALESDLTGGYMKLKLLLLVCTLGTLSLSAAVTGDWRGTTVAPNHTTHTTRTVAIYAILAQSGESVTGTAGTLGKLEPIQGAVLNGTSLTFWIGEGGGPKRTTFQLNTEGNELVGFVVLHTGQRLPITLKPYKP
jgi:hypothetical protein